MLMELHSMQRALRQQHHRQSSPSSSSSSRPLSLNSALVPNSNSHTASSASGNSSSVSNSTSSESDSSSSSSSLAMMASNGSREEASRNEPRTVTTTTATTMEDHTNDSGGSGTLWEMMGSATVNVKIAESSSATRDDSPIPDNNTCSNNNKTINASKTATNTSSSSNTSTKSNSNKNSITHNETNTNSLYSPTSVTHPMMIPPPFLDPNLIHPPPCPRHYPPPPTGKHPDPHPHPHRHRDIHHTPPSPRSCVPSMDCKYCPHSPGGPDPIRDDGQNDSIPPHLMSADDEDKANNDKERIHDHHRNEKKKEENDDEDDEDGNPRRECQPQPQQQQQQPQQPQQYRYHHQQAPLPFHTRDQITFAERSIQRLVKNSDLFPPGAASDAWFRRRDAAMANKEEENTIVHSQRCCRQCHRLKTSKRCLCLKELISEDETRDEDDDVRYANTDNDATMMTTMMRKPTPTSTDVTSIYEHELHVEQLLGHGGFCEVRLAYLTKEKDNELRKKEKEELETTTTTTTIPQKYAMKYLAPSLEKKSKKSFSRGVADLAIEARFLSVIRHENIIALHHVSAGSLSRNYNCFDAGDDDDDGDHHDGDDCNILVDAHGNHRDHDDDDEAREAEIFGIHNNYDFDFRGDDIIDRTSTSVTDTTPKRRNRKTNKPNKVLLRSYGYFLVLDCLHETLLNRIKSTYIPQVTCCSGHHPKDHHSHHHHHCDVHPHLLEQWQGLQYSSPTHPHHDCTQGNDHWWNNVSNWGHGNKTCSLSLSSSSSSPRKDSKTRNMQNLLAKRLSVLKSIASALEYLHDECHVVFRDIKPDNIGFYRESLGCDGACDDGTYREVPKLYDFGLAKELKEIDRVPSDDHHRCDDDDDDDATYKLTSKTGSRRYMSPEVALCRTYNRKADVYSFGMLIYEIATLVQPFEGYTMHRHEAEVLRRGRRPCLAGYAPSSPSSSTSSLLAPLAASKLVSSLSGSNNSAGVNDYWPRDLKSLIEDCWHSDMRARPRMKDVVRRLEDCIRELTPSDTSSKLEKASSSTCQSMVAKTDESPAKDGTRVETTARSLLSGSFRGRKATKLQQYPSKKSEPFGDDSKVASSPSSSSSSSYSSSGKGEAAAPAADSVEHRKGRTHSPATTSNAIDGKSRKKLEQFIATAAFAIPSPSRSLSRSRSGGSKRRVASSSSKGRRHRKSNSKDDCTIQQKSQPKQQQQLPKPKPTTTNEAHQKKQQGGDDISTPATAGTSSKSAKTTSKKLGKKSVWTSLLSQFKHDLTSAASPRSEFCKHDPCRWNAV